MNQFYWEPERLDDLYQFNRSDSNYDSWTMNHSQYLPAVGYIESFDTNGNVLQPADWRIVSKTIQVICDEYPQTGNDFFE